MSDQRRAWASATGRFAFVCPYCGTALDVSERDVTALCVESRVDDLTRIDVSFLSRHRCAA